MTTFPTTYYPWQKLILAGRETVAGTPVTSALYLEECRSLTSDTQMATERETGYFNVPVTDFDETLMQAHTQGSFTVPFRNAGMGAAMLLGFLGSGATVDTGAADPYSHTATTSPTTTRIDTWTFYESRGDVSNVKQIAYGTPSSISLSSAPSGAVTAAVNYTGAAPLFVAKAGLTVGQYVGSTPNYLKTRQMGNSWSLTLYNSSNVAYTCSVTHLDLTFTRSVGQVPNINGTSPLDFPTGVIQTSGRLSFRYDGSGAGTLYRDFEGHKQLGDSSHVHQAVWTDTDSHTLTIKFGPIYLSNCRLSDGQEYVTGDVDFTAINDISQANQASPVISSIKQIIVTNAISGAMP